MDALSEVLTTVRMTSAIFFNAEFRAPWGLSAPHARSAVDVLAPGAEHLVTYHLVTEGEALVKLEGKPELRVVAGDIVVLPHGDPHIVRGGAPSRLMDGIAVLPKYLSGDLSVTRYGGSGAVTRFICGFLGCDRQAERTFLAGLPSVVRVGIRGDAAGAWLESSIRHLVSDGTPGRPGRDVLLSKMADALFVETLRRYADQLPPGQNGWLAAARDPVVGAALALMHRKPRHPWTVAGLAAAAGASRSVLAERFVRFLGEPPLSYLTRWRLQLAARLLQTSSKSVLQLTSDVGYESEAAFNRAFKREFGVPPARYRRQFRGRTDAAPGWRDVSADVPAECRPRPWAS